VKLLKLLLAFYLGCFSLGSFADCYKQNQEVICSSGTCTSNQYGKLSCAAAGGDAVRAKNGSVVCGVGKCAKDQYGEIWCSSQVGGGAIKNSSGNVECLGGCQLGSSEYCELFQQ
jgi:hypothetical protein